MVTFFFTAYILIGIAQIWAGIEGMQLYFGMGGLLAVILLFVAYAIPFVGTIAVAFLTYYGARYGWKWEWWQALMLVVPGIVLMLAAGVAIGLAIWAQRLGGLISLHHHLAPATETGKNLPNRLDTEGYRISDECDAHRHHEALATGRPACLTQNSTKLSAKKLSDGVRQLNATSGCLSDSFIVARGDDVVQIYRQRARHVQQHLACCQETSRCPLRC